MAFWTGSQEQTTQCDKFGTVPGRYFSHFYQNKRHAADYRQYFYEQPEHACKPSYWTMPGSRTGGVLQDYTNWTEHGTSQHFPFTLESQARRQGHREHIAPERLERDWLSRDVLRAQRERQEKERERVMQRERWESLSHSQSPVHYRKEGAKRSLSSSSYRELEAWAARYCHSLPRRKRLEAGLYGPAQAARTNQPTREWPERGYSGDTYQRPLTNMTELPYETRQYRHWERPDAHQPPPYKAPPGLPDPERIARTNLKDNAPSLQKRAFSSPPCYIPPPPYGPSHNGGSSAALEHHPSKSQVEKGNMAPAWEQQFRSQQNYCTLPVRKRHEYTVQPQLQRSNTQDTKGMAWTGRTESHLAWDGSRYYEKATPKSWDSTAGITSPPVPLSDRYVAPESQKQPQVTEVSGETPPDVPGSTRNKVKKRRGGETIFCLVSRMGNLAGLSSSPDDPLKAQSLPLYAVTPHPCVDKGAQAYRNQQGSGESQTTPQLPDEVDAGVAAPDCPSSSSVSIAPSHTSLYKTNSDPKPKVRGAQHWMNDEKAAAHRDELMRAIQKCSSKLQDGRRNFNSLPIRGRSTETSSRECTIPASFSSPSQTRKAGTPSQSETSVKFPLWREPKVPCQSKYPSEQKEETGETSCIQNPNDNAIGEELKQSEVGNDLTSDNSDGILVIDATCVVVRVEFIFPPKKEHVKYVCSPPCSVSEAEHGSVPSNNLVQNTEPVINSHPFHGVAESLSPPKDDDSLSNELWKSPKENEVNKSTPSGFKTSHTNLTEDLTDQRANIPLLDSELPPLRQIATDKESMEERAIRILAIPHLEPSSQEISNQAQMKDAPSCHHDTKQEEECCDYPVENLPTDTSSPDTYEHDSEAVFENQVEENLVVPLQTEMNDSEQKVITHQPLQNDEHEENMNFSKDISDDNTSEETHGLIKTLPDLNPQSSLELEHQLTEESLVPSLGMGLTSEQIKTDCSVQSLSNTSTPRSNTPCDYPVDSVSTDTTDTPPPVSVTDLELDLLPASGVTGPLVTPPSPTESPDSKFPSPPPTPSVSFSPSTSPLPLPTPPPPPSLSPPPLILTPPPPSNFSSPSSVTPPLSPLPPSSPVYAHSVYPLSGSSPSPPPSHSSSPSSDEGPPTQSSPLLPPEVSGALELDLITALPPAVSSEQSPPREEPQYPKSLWDAVHRIRKHTAPDSENEEEELVESWENPESVCSDVTTLNLDQELLDQEHEAGDPQKVTLEYWTTVEDECPTNYNKFFKRGTVTEEDVGSFSLIAQNKDSKKCVEEDTLSCSSSDSHASNDTVIMGEEEDRLTETEAGEQRVEDLKTHPDQSEKEEDEASPWDLNQDSERNSGREPPTTILDGKKDSKECTQICMTDHEELGDCTDMKESVCHLVEEEKQRVDLTEIEGSLH